jgi:hypothetical protein
MVGQFFAVALVVLCLLPGTAPFLTLDSMHSLGGPRAVRANTSLETHASAKSLDDDDDAIVLERSTILRQMRSRALVVAGSAETAGTSTAFLSSVAPPASADRRPSLKTILRV